MAKYSVNDPPQVLVVDDHEISSLHSVSTLDTNGIAVRRAASGKEALDSVADWVPDLVLMDLCLPDMDGLEVIRRLQQCLPGGAAAPVFVIISGTNPERRRHELEALGISQALVKPITSQRLLNIVTAATRRTVVKGSAVTPETRITPLFKAELEKRLPEMERHLIALDYHKAAELVHQLLASCAMTGQQRLQRKFIHLNRQLAQQAGPGALARAYFSARQEALEFLHGND